MNRLKPFIFGFLLTLLLSWWGKSAALSSSFELRLLHTNDHHAHLEPVQIAENQILGGIARRKTLVDRLRNESKVHHQPLLLLDAGDVFQGTLYFNTYHGQADLDFYNSLDYDAMTVGNHEFDRGQETLAKFIEKAEFPILSANLKIDSTSPLEDSIRPWIIIERNQEKIGIFGLTTDRTPILAEVGPGIEFADPIVSAQKAVAELTEKGVNKIIALTHLGMKNDLELARQVDGIDIIIGGHSHTRLGRMSGAEQPYPIVEKTPDGTPVLVATDWEWGKYLGDLQVTFDRQGKLMRWSGEPRPIDRTIIPDRQFETILAAFQEPIQTLKATIIGETLSKLNGDRPDIRLKATNLGQLIAEAMLSKTAPNGTQFAMTNGGGIRASIPQGPIAIGQVLEVLPFGNTIVQIDLTGAEIEEALEHGVSETHDGGGCFPQVAGLTFTWDEKQPIGSRITSVKIRQPDGSYAPLNHDQMYRMATSSFLFKGGDGYVMFGKTQNQLNTGYLISDTLIDYIRQYSPIP